MIVRLAFVTSFCLGLATFSYGQATVVVPNLFNGSEANVATGVPLQNSGSPRTYQMQIGASQLLTMPIGSSITGLRWRLDAGQAATFPPSTATWSLYEITLAQAANPMASFSSNFAANMVNPALVRSTSLSFTAGVFSNLGSPTNFGPIINFDTPYTYQGGDLVLLLTHGGSNIATAGILDAADSTSPGYGTNYRAQFGIGFQATNASATDFQAIVTQFQFTAAVPEPATWALLAGSTVLVAITGAHLRRRRLRLLNTSIEE